jgi:hypothetical protein
VQEEIGKDTGKERDWRGEGLERRGIGKERDWRGGARVWSEGKGRGARPGPACLEEGLAQ